jgi:hypothetical protein
MSIEINLPLDALKDPAVSSALASLMTALGGHSPGAGRRTSAPRSAPAAAPAARKARKAKRKKAMDWPEFEASLSPATQRFLGLIQDRKRLKLADAVTELGLKEGKSMGGLTGALARKARNNNLDLPYTQQRDRKGQRVWVATKSGLSAKDSARKLSTLRKKSSKAAAK